jgi:hypothetical protein
VLLLYPPASRSSEPPLGMARLAGFLRAKGFRVACLDLCQEGLDFLLSLPEAAIPGPPAGLARDTWTRGALRRRESNLELLRGGAAFSSIDRYRRAVLDLNRALKAASSGSGAEAGLADYREEGRSPLRRADLLAAAASFEENAFFPLFSRRIEEELASSPARAVGISLCYLSQALCAFAIAGYIKRAHPCLRLILGGGLVGSWAAQGRVGPEERFGGLFDAIIPGRGEEGILGALRAFGIEPTGPAFGAAAAEAPTASRIASAAPYFSDLSGLRYLSPERVLPYNFSWGCPWRRCGFCPEKAERHPYAGLRADRAMGELRALVEAGSPGLLHFTDNEVAPLYLRALADSPPGPRWYGFARFTTLLADAAFCERLAASGCALLQLGLESGDQAVLDAMGKGTRLEEIDRALASLAAAGIGTYVYLLFGTPREDRDSALRTRDFVAARADRIGFLNVAVFNLPAASEEAASLETRPFYEGELSLYREFSHPAGWDRGAVRSFLARDFEGEAAIKPILARNPPVFTSSHAAFFTRPR